ncbi:S8 family serine peptidase [Pedobacter sp. SD-b]|uniref:S8 family serine peptidase n=1 Tax=Pedobacter segetis TaxID=2793069 RepID=A0ABS1BM15_9SPHI|nr:S8 family serine peptidase [Pedobacter segetis]MBK0383940.1 S8 family serine peptidase [Pedobacter segetis]
MKKISLLLFLFFASIYSFAQLKDSLKIVKTNEQGLSDPERKMPIAIDGIDFKNLDYVKGRLVVKFKPNVLNFAVLNDVQFRKEAIKMVGEDTKALPNSLTSVFQDIVSYRPLTKIPQKIVQKEAIEKDSLKNEDDHVYNIVVIDCKEGNEEALAKKLLKTGLFEYVSPDYKLYLDTPPNDNAYYLQAGLDQANDIDIDVEDAWLTNTGSPNVRVAILDTGIDYNNDDLGNGTWNVAGAKVRAGYNYYDGNSNPLDNDITSSHGTAVGGIIGAYRNNNNRVAGIAGGDATTGNAGVSLYALKVFSGSDGTSRPTGSSSAMAAALIDAAKPESEGGYGCQIANYSGGSPASSGGSFINMFLPGNPAYDAMRYAARHNLLFVAAKGNENTNALHYPSDIKDNWVLSVGASNGSDQRASFSNFGNNIDVVAPGTSDLVYTTKRVASGSEGSFNGTSAAAPVAAGVAALLKSQNMALHRDDIEQLIKLSAVKVGTYTYTNGYNEEMGFGKVNAANAMAYLKAPYQLMQNTVTGGAIESISGTMGIFLTSGSELAEGYYTGKHYQVKTTIQKPFCSGENYLWPRIEGASKGWSGANPNNQENYIYQNNETSTSVDLTTWVYYIQSNTLGQTINAWYPCAPQDVKFAYTALGLSEYYKINQPISGVSSICEVSGNYEIADLPAGVIVNWSITGNATTLSQTNNIATLTKINDGFVTLTATINTPCGTVIRTKEITVGIPYFNSVVLASSTGPSNYFIATGDPVIVTINPLYPHAISYHWEMFPYPDEDYYIQNGLPVPSGNITGSSSSVTIEMYVPGVYRVSVKAVTECGESEPQETYFEAVGPGSLDGIYSYNIFPNPVSSELTVSYETEKNIQKSSLKQTQLAAMAKSYHVQLLNDRGMVLRDMENRKDNSKIVINTLDIPNGTYYLHIFHNDKKVINSSC